MGEKFAARQRRVFSEDGQERVRRWMQSMVLVEPHAPVAERFTEVGLRAAGPPR